MKIAKTVLPLLLGIAAITSVTISQTPSGTKPSFEVATVKANTRLGPSVLNKAGIRLVATGLPLRPLIMEAYRVHREVKQLSVYELTVTRGGPKLKVSADQTKTRVSETKLGNGFVEVPGQPFRNFVYFLGRQLDRPLIDTTGLKGLYDVTLRWTPEPTESTRTSEFPTLFTAVEEQLGLKLESGKGAVDMFVIDSVKRPSEN